MRVTFDTNVFEKYRVNAGELARSFRFSAVVIQELTAGAWDGDEVTAWADVRVEYEKDNRLLVPTGEDWWFAGKVLNSLLRTPSRRGRTSIGKDEQRLLIRDTLIARTAKRDGVTVITQDLDDFAKIQRFCAVKLMHPDQYF